MSGLWETGEGMPWGPLCRGCGGGWTVTPLQGEGPDCSVEGTHSPQPNEPPMAQHNASARIQLNMRVKPDVYKAVQKLQVLMANESGIDLSQVDAVSLAIKEALQKRTQVQNGAPKKR